MKVIGSRKSSFKGDDGQEVSGVKIVYIVARGGGYASDFCKGGSSKVEPL